MSILDDLQRYSQPLGDLGKVASGIAAGRASGRTSQADFNLRSGIAQGDANTNAVDANARRRAAALSDALRGRLLQGTSDATISGLPYGVNPPTITGGARPSNIVGADALGKSLAAHGDATLAQPDIKPQNFDNLAPSPNILDTLANVGGDASSILGVLGKVGALGKAAPSLALPGAASLSSLGIGGGGGAATSGGLGSTVGGLLTNPITLAAGAGLGIAYAIKKHQNATKGDRNQFAKDAGFPDIAAFNNYLSTLGPAGQAAREYGENVVGKHNKQQEAQWTQMVQQAVNQGRG